VSHKVAITTINFDHILNVPLYNMNNVINESGKGIFV